MYKRLLSLLLTFAILVSLVPTQIFAAERNTVGAPSTVDWHELSSDTAANGSDEQQSLQFEDIKSSDWFYNAVTYVQQNGLFSGTDNDRFSPNGTMTRAMYVTVLGRMAGVDVSQYTTSTFGDVRSNAWYMPYVQWAVDKGITGGTGNHKFSPDTAITREQMATLTLRFFEVYNIPYQTNVSLTSKPNDITDISSWAVDAIVKLWQAGLLTGDANGNFNPHSHATRAEAATFSMRSNEVVKAGTTPDPEEPTPSSTPTTTNPSSGGSGSGTGTTSYTITFETNGGSSINNLTLSQGAPLNNLSAPQKAGFIFQGWYKDSGLTQPVKDNDTVTGNITLYANYISSPDSAVASIPSITVLDQAPSFSIQVNDATGKMTAAQVKAGMSFESSANPAFAGIIVTGSNGRFRVASAAQDGKFEEGNTYQITLTDSNLSFQGQDATTTIYGFSIAKQAVLNVPLNPDMIYLSFKDVSNMMLDGADVDSPSIPVITTGVGDSGAKLNEANAANGTFDYTGETEIQVGDTVAIYEGARPDLRTAETSDADNGDVAYVRITAIPSINGSTYAYTHADSKKVLNKPDVLPVSVAADTDGDATNQSITVEHSAMNYSNSQYAPMGLNELTVVNAGDFIAFYNGEFGREGTSVGYGLITSITHDAEMDIIAYTDATLDQVTSALNVYQQQALDGDQLLSDEDVAALEGQVKQQAVASGFVDEAADYLSDLALHTDSFKQQYSRLAPMAATSVASKVNVENLTVVPSVSTTLKHISGHTSGVSVSLQVGADIVIPINDKSDIVIHLTSTFVEEMYFDLGVNGDTEWHWYWIFPILDDYIITANLDAYTYTGINITAEIATVDADQLEDALEDWDKAENNGALGQVENIATELKALIAGVQDTGVDAKTLRDRYQSMLQDETEWVPLIRKNLVDKSVRVCIGIVEVNFSVDFVVSANVNLTVGIDFNYKSAKRYSATVRIFSFTGSSNTVSLPGDGDYQFKFYVLGTLGLRAGVNVELKAGVGSVKWDSIGISVEPGVYLNLRGYFYYELKNSAGNKATTSLGALYLELGIYLESAFGAQLGDGMLSADVPIYDNEWPLFSAGANENVFDFDYLQDDTLDLTFAGSLTSLPVSYLFTMSVLNLKTGDTNSKAFPPSNFDIQVDNSNFKFDANTKTISVVDKTIAGSTGNLVITWKNAPLAFTTKPIKRTIPLTWSAKSGNITILLDPQNDGGSLVVSAPYNATIKAPATPTYLGYTFDGWYTDASYGTKYTIPSKMPAEDIRLYAHWIANKNTPYTVLRYLIDPNTGNAVLKLTENKTGTTGAGIYYEANDYVAGIGNIASPVRDVIKGDGSTIVRLYYNPFSSTIYFNWGYSVANNLSKVTAPVDKDISSLVPLLTRPGYKFAGWSPSIPSKMPSVGGTYTALWTPKTDTPYAVVHLQQDINANTYTVVDTESYVGVTDTTTSTATPKSYEGFSFDKTIAGTVLSDKIVAGGTTVLKLYYKRNTYKVTFDSNGGTGGTTINVAFGASTSNIPKPQVTRSGYIFAGWSSSLSPMPQTMPAQAVTYTAQWVAADEITGVTIDHTSPQVGDILTATATMGDGKTAGDRVTYEWMVEDIVGSNRYVSATGVGKTTASYTVAAADVGKKLQVWVYGANEGLGMVLSTATNKVQAAFPTSGPLPEWITSAPALDLTSATVTVASSTEVSISGAALTDDWTIPEDVTLNLSNMTLNDHTLTIAEGTTLNISDSTVDGNIEVLAGATLNVRDTTLDEGYTWDILANATLNVNGTVTLAMAASLVVDGAFHIPSSATVINNGTITGYESTGDITNNGTITNNNSISNSGTIMNNGTITNLATGVISNFGTITNSGMITNNGSIVNIEDAIINNDGGSFTGNVPITL